MKFWRLETLTVFCASVVGAGKKKIGVKKSSSLTNEGRSLRKRSFVKSSDAEKSFYSTMSKDDKEYCGPKRKKSRGEKKVSSAEGSGARRCFYGTIRRSGGPRSREQKRLSAEKVCRRVKPPTKVYRWMRLPVRTKKVYGRMKMEGEMLFQGEITLGFKERDVFVCYCYAQDNVKMLDTIMENAGDEASDFVRMPDFMTKEDLDTFLNIFEKDPAVDMMDAKALAHTLRIAEYLRIAEKDDERSYALDLFSRVCEYSILGAHGRNILETQLYRFESSVKEGSPMYTRLAWGLASVSGVEMRVLEGNDGTRTLTLYTPDWNPPIDGWRELGSGVGITKIKITHFARIEIENGNETDGLEIMMWLFDHTMAKGLDLSTCYVGENIIRKIGNLVHLEVLDLRYCDMEQGSLVCIGRSRVLRTVLRELYLIFAILDIEDTRALGLLVALEVLSLRYCKLQKGSLVPIGRSATLGRVLCELHVDGNRFNLEDTTALGELGVLRVLSLTDCKLPAGSFEPIYTRLVVRRILHRLSIGDNNEFDWNDREMVRKAKPLLLNLVS